jgi:hypothetical protein
MEAHPNFKARYLHSTFLGLEPVTTGHDLRNRREAFDITRVVCFTFPIVPKPFNDDHRNCLVYTLDT